MFPLQPTDRLCSYYYYCLPGYRVQKRKREGGGDSSRLLLRAPV